MQAFNGRAHDPLTPYLRRAVRGVHPSPSHYQSYLKSALGAALAALGAGANGLHRLDLGYGAMAIGLFLASTNLVLVGAALFFAVMLFQLVTLPVEFNTSNRAKALIVGHGIIAEQEREGVDRVLNAAALTYVAAAVSTLLTLLYFLWRAGLPGGRR